MYPRAEEGRYPQQSEREREFLRRWIGLAGPPLQAQYAFHPTRRWRLDWAHPQSRIAIEIHGGTWTGGRHVRGLGFAADRIKINAALRLNWKVFELTTADLGDDRIYLEIVDEIARRQAEAVANRSSLIPLADVHASRSRSRSRRHGMAR